MVKHTNTTGLKPLEQVGEKAELNGTLNFSVKDGWWYEGYVEGAGWALTEKQTYEKIMSIKMS